MLLISSPKDSCTHDSLVDLLASSIKLSGCIILHLTELTGCVVAHLTNLVVHLVCLGLCVASELVELGLGLGLGRLGVLLQLLCGAWNVVADLLL